VYWEELKNKIPDGKRAIGDNGYWSSSKIMIVTTRYVTDSEKPKWPGYEFLQWTPCVW
jgi:hypothetical protein